MTIVRFDGLRRGVYVLLRYFRDPCLCDKWGFLEFLWFIYKILLKVNENTNLIHEYSTIYTFIWLEDIMKHIRRIFWLLWPYSIILVIVRVRGLCMLLDGLPSHILSFIPMINNFNKLSLLYFYFYIIIFQYKF